VNTYDAIENCHRIVLLGDVNMALSTSKQLLEALILLRENETDVQREMAKQIKARKVKAKKPERVLEDDEEKSSGDEEKSGDEEGGEEPEGESLFGDEEGGDEEGGDEEDGDDSKGDESKDDGGDKGLAGAEELIDTPQELPQTLKGNDFIDKINKIRAGSSLNDKEVQTKIISYVKSLTVDERDDLWVNLDSLARIILGGLDPAQVLTPSLITGPNKQKKSVQKQTSSSKPQEKKKQPPGANLPIVAPVSSLGEGVKRKLTEVPFVLKSNKTVPFGHSAHIRDLERILSDLMRFRSCQERGTESYMSITLAIRTIKGQLATALKKSIDSKTSIDGVNMRMTPPLIEQD
jgi:hypothetical protein